MPFPNFKGFSIVLEKINCEKLEKLVIVDFISLGRIINGEFNNFRNVQKHFFELRTNQFENDANEFVVSSRFDRYIAFVSQAFRFRDRLRPSVRMFGSRSSLGDDLGNGEPERRMRYINRIGLKRPSDCRQLPDDSELNFVHVHNVLMINNEMAVGRAPKTIKILSLVDAYFPCSFDRNPALIKV